MKSWQLTIDENGVIDLPDELLQFAGWKSGDVLSYIDNKDGTYTIVKEDLINFIQQGKTKNEQNKGS